MKKKLLKAGFAFAFLFFLIGNTNVFSQTTDTGGSITYQTFYDDLSPYGSWMITRDMAMSGFQPELMISIPM